MQKISAIALIGMVTIIANSCGTNSNQDNTATTTSAPQIVPAQPATQPFTQPLVNQQPTVAIASAPALIQSTNGNQRAKQVEAGRPDPFAGIFIQSGLSGGTGGTSGVANPSRTNPQPSGTTNSTTNSTSTTASTSNPNTGNTGNNSGTPSNSTPSTLPPLPPDPGFDELPPSAQAPDIANAVGVTGVIQIGEEMQAIVQVPSEGTSRYVGVGQLLSNGQVLVKRIEMNEGSEPTVILEQYGVEVAKAVGEKPPNAQQNAPTDGTATPPQNSPASAFPENNPDATLVSPAPDNTQTEFTDDGSQQQVPPPPLDDGSSIPNESSIPTPSENLPGTVPEANPILPPSDESTGVE